MAREMKDSGVEWIREIPVGWSRNKVARLFDIIGSGTTPKSIDESNFFGDISWIQSGDINGGYINSAKHRVSQNVVKKYSALKVYTAPFIVIAMYGASIGNISISKIDGCVNQACCVLSGSKLCFKYVFYTIQATKDYLIQKGIGGGQPNISQEIIKQLWLPVPTLEEQNYIANFLDRKCAEIDAIIDKTRLSIEEYEKLKQAIITQAVTKGIRGDRPMKDSGVTWVGEIPADWKVAKAKYYVTIQNGSDPKLDGDIPVYGSGADSFKTCGEYKDGPAVLIGRKGATLHIPHYIEDRYWNVDTAFDVHATYGMFLRYYYYSAICFDYKFYMSQTTLPGMTQTSYENMLLPIPSFGEQKEIADYLDKKCAEIDALIEQKVKLLFELETYKKSLIYEYVTGKKSV